MILARIGVRANSQRAGHGRTRSDVKLAECAAIDRSASDRNRPDIDDRSFPNRSFKRWESHFRCGRQYRCFL